MLGVLYRAAAEVAAEPGSQGLIGRLLGELIGDRKFLATFYTLPSSAALLAEMAVARLELDWSDPEAVTSLRVGDMACGTGALLTAAYQRICERHLLAGGDPAAVHRGLVEDAMIGCDIMPAAVHLTAARLSGEHPEIDYTATNTWVMPYGSTADVGGGGDVIKLGALDLQHSTSAMALWGDGSIAATSRGEVRHTTAHIDAESLDIVIMNPPFTRPTNHESAHSGIPNPAFAGLGNDAAAQAAMSRALQPIVAGIPEPRAGNGNAGLASNFVDLAHAKLKPGGVLALVLPAVAMSGGSWKQARRLLSERYSDIHVATISSRAAAATDRAFSADTGMGELLLVARKNTGSGSAGSGNMGSGNMGRHSGQASYTVLDDRPPSVAWGVEMARASAQPGDGRLSVGGEAIGWKSRSLFTAGHGHPSGVAEEGLAITAGHLSAGRLRLPRLSDRGIPIADLASLGHAGPVDRDINGVNRQRVEARTVSTPRGPFTVRVLEKRKLYLRASYPTLWSHDAEHETTMTVLPSSQARPRRGMREQALRVWAGGYRTRARNSRIVAGATRLHINRDFRVTSQPLGACLTPVPALGGRAWPSFGVAPDDPSDAQLWEDALCAWMNTTLGLIARWWVSSRQQQGRSCLTITTLGAIPVLDLRSLQRRQVAALSDVFNAFSDRPLLPANQADRCTTRHALDEEVLCEALGLPDEILDPLSTLRQQWCREPSNQ